MKNFEYVTKRESAPIRKELEKLINLVQDEVREYFTFQFYFIGSASRNMITCDSSSNVGFDFDVNIKVNDDEEKYRAKEIRDILRRGFDKYSRHFSYDYVEDSTRVLTIKVKDIENSRIIHSCDFAIVHDAEKGKQQYIHFNKNQRTYEWQYQPNEFYRLKEMIIYIKEIGQWNKVRDLYLELKNKDLDRNKKSRHIFVDTINQIYKL